MADYMDFRYFGSFLFGWRVGIQYQLEALPHYGQYDGGRLCRRHHPDSSCQGIGSVRHSAIFGLSE